MTYRPSISAVMVEIFKDQLYFLRLDSFFLNYFYSLLYYGLAISSFVLLWYKGNAQCLNSTDDLDAAYLFIEIFILILFVALLSVLVIFTPCEVTCKIGAFLVKPFGKCCCPNEETIRVEDDVVTAEPLIETEDDDDTERVNEKAVLIV